MKKVLFVLSSHSQFGTTNETTGWWMSEASHPWKELKDAGYEVDFVSPQGGEPPVTGVDMKDEINKLFMADQNVTQKLKNTLTPADIKIDDYGALLFVGGHGACFDFPNNKELNELTARFYESKRIVCAVCHGLAGLLNVRLSDDTYLLKDKVVTGFTDKEELQLRHCYDVPFLLQAEMMLRGCDFKMMENWSDNVQVDKNLITGQNPQSAKSVGVELVRKMKDNKGKWEELVDFLR